MLNYGGVGSGTYGGANAVIAGIAAFTGGNTWFVPSGGASGTAATAPADTSEDTLATVVLPALSSSSIIRVTHLWTVTNNANNKTAKIKIGSTVIWTLNLASIAQFQDQRVIFLAGATNAEKAFGLQNGAYGSTSASSVAGAVETNAGVTMTITIQKATAGDTATLEGFLFEIYKP